MADVENTPSKKAYDPNDTVNSIDDSKDSLNDTAQSPDTSLNESESLVNGTASETESPIKSLDKSTESTKQDEAEIQLNGSVETGGSDPIEDERGGNQGDKDTPQVSAGLDSSVNEDEKPAEPSLNNGDEVKDMSSDDEPTTDAAQETNETDEQKTLKEVIETVTEPIEEKPCPQPVEATEKSDVTNQAELAEDTKPREAAVDVEDVKLEPERGPDKVIETDKLMTWQRDEAVKIRMEEQGPASEKPVSMTTVFKTVAQRSPNLVALAQKKKDGEWKKWTYAEYYTEARTAGKAFIKLGLEPYHGVGIIGFNSPEWLISDMGAILASGFAVGIYTTNSPAACQYVADNCEANIIVVENNAQLQKILKVWPQLPHLKAIVQYSEKPEVKQDNVYGWDDFMSLGRDEDETKLEERIALQAPNKCAMLVYTSGTTGHPKGVMISHDNLTWTSRQVAVSSGLRYGQEVIVSYLPLSHIAAQILDVIGPISIAGAVYFAQPDALKGSLGDTLREVRPTAFFGVPRVWEKIQEKFISGAKNVTGMKKKLSTWAKDVGFRGNISKMNGGGTPFGWTIANALVFKKVRGLLGLDRCRIFYSGAAPITRETLDYFLSLNIPLYEIYGMSECTGPHTMGSHSKYRIGSVGSEFTPAVKTILDSPDDDGNGEICKEGRHVFMGYLANEEKTKEALDDKGRLHSGDIGKKEDGFLYITGRIKELIITAGGENIAPVPIEDNVKAELPCISNAMLIGDKRKFLSMLLSLKAEADPTTGEPHDELVNTTVEWCAAQGSKATKVSEILDGDEKVLKAIQDGIDRANAKSVSRAQKIAKWSIIPKDFSIPGEELGPTMKLKRTVVVKKYKDTIEAFYKE